jgi:MFS family permease
VSRIKLPEFIHEVIDDPRQRGVLVAGSLALFAVGLVPRVLSPGLPTAQDALRSEPELQNLFLLLAFLSTAAIILGGLVSDIFRRRSLMLGGLTVMLVGSAISIVVSSGLVFYTANIAAIVASGVVLAYGIGTVAVTYEGVARATALGFVYAAFGVGTMISPALITLFPRIIPSDDPAVASSFTFDTWLAYLLATLGAGLALWASARWTPAIPGTLPTSRRFVITVAVWSMAVLAIVTGVLGLRGPTGMVVPIILIIGGSVALSTVTVRYRQTLAMTEGIDLDRRGLGAALAVGVAVGFAQAVPLMMLPIVFEYPLNYGTLLAMVAIAPFAVALLLAGPISGILIRRFGPRGIMTLGTFMLGVANLGVALVLVWIAGHARSTFAADPTGGSTGLAWYHYGLFILPMILIGAGFVVSTTVRTAIVFASTPRGLPASAAAINEASVSLGSRIGIVAATAALTAAALASARDMVSRHTTEIGSATALVEEFELALVSLGTPRFEEIYRASLEGAEPIKQTAYSVAYLDGVVTALAMSGVVGIGGAVLAWFLTGRRNPIETVFDMQDERHPEHPGEAERGSADS